MKKQLTLTVLVLLCICIATQAQNFNKIAGKAIKKAIGSDLKGFQIFSYPTDNFGLITAYDKQVDDKNFLCDTWNCIGKSAPEANSPNWLDIDSFAAVGGGGTIELTQKKKSKLALNVVLPKIYNVLGITAGVNNENTKEINITIGKAYMRKLRRKEMAGYINNRLGNDVPMKQSFNGGTLVLIVADCIIQSISVSVKVDNTFQGALDAKLSGAASKIFNDASLSVSVEKTSSGTYSFKIDHPIIYARLSKQQPGAGLLEDKGDNEWTDWGNREMSYDPSVLKKSE